MLMKDKLNSSWICLNKMPQNITDLCQNSYVNFIEVDITEKKMSIGVQYNTSLMKTAVDDKTISTSYERSYFNVTREELHNFAQDSMQILLDELKINKLKSYANFSSCENLSTIEVHCSKLLIRCHLGNIPIDIAELEKRSTKQLFKKSLLENLVEKNEQYAYLEKLRYRIPLNNQMAKYLIPRINYL